MELLVGDIGIVAFPLAVRVLAVTLLDSVHIDFAEVVEDREVNCLLFVRLNFGICGKQSYELVINIEETFKNSDANESSESFPSYFKKYRLVAPTTCTIFCLI